jgi:Trk K+ transport system NAD-binding subunit
MENQAQKLNQSPLLLDYFLVCGLGSLGQNCLVALKEFGVKVIAIEQNQAQTWEVSNLPQLLDDLIIGDCREDLILKKAKVEKCRSVLILTSDEDVNAQTALAVRQLNPHTRILVRSEKENLNQLLEQQLGNFFADDPTKLTATAFALASLGTATLGFFYLEGQRLQVIQRKLTREDSWTNSRYLHQLNTSRRQILAHLTPHYKLTETFHQWEPDAVVQANDILIYLEKVDEFFLTGTSKLKRLGKSKIIWRKQLKLALSKLKIELSKIWQFSFLRQIKRVGLFSLIIVSILLLIGTFLFKQYYPNTTFLHSFYATAVLLLGGYADLFGQFEPVTEIPWWLQLFALLLTVVGTAFVGVLYALLTEALLSAKFELIRARPPIPQNNHIVIIGLEKFGQGIATVLNEFKKTLLGVAFNADFDRTILPKMPLIIGNLQESLQGANLGKAKSIVITTDNEMLNLEIALMIRSINPTIPLVIATYGKALSKKLTHLLDNVQILAFYEVAAEAFAGAAFGENIISLFRLNNRTILVTEYQIEAEDTLHNLLIAEAAYGYEVVIVLHQHQGQESTFMPLPEIRLKIGDRIVVLATTEGLRRIEQGRIKITSKCWQVRVKKVLNPDAYFNGANDIARITGYSLGKSRDLMNNLPQTIPTPLYKHQAQYLVRELKKSLVQGEVISLF